MRKTQLLGVYAPADYSPIAKIVAWGAAALVGWSVLVGIGAAIVSVL